MTFKQKNTAVTLTSFSLILIFYLSRIAQLLQEGALTTGGMFRLFGLVVLLSIVVTIVATILTHVVTAVLEVIRTGNEEPVIEDLEDERDQLIDLKGTRVAYTASSSGAALAMLSYVVGQPPLVMFALLIFFGILAQILGDATRLILYQRGA